MKALSWLFFLLTVLTFTNHAYSQGANCNTSNPFCTGSTTTFPAGVGVQDAMIAEPGNNYGCLGSAPNPAWYFMEIDQPGNMTIDITNSAGVDIDFALWGPFPNLATAMGNCGSLGSPYDCSYSPVAYPEIVQINGAVTGEVYILLVTNFANVPTNVSFTNTAGAATTNCSIVNPCVITSLSTNPTPCNPATNTYDISGSIVFNDPPTSGTLTVTDCHGNSQVFNSPFASPINYSMTGITANGVPCNVTAVFSADPGCTFTTNYATPAPCAPSCLMDSMPIVMTNCYSTPSLAYDVSGTLYFNNPPSSGTLTITPCSGAPLVFNAPFASPLAFNFTGLPQTGTNCAFTAVFSADPTCTKQLRKWYIPFKWYRFIFKSPCFWNINC